MKKILLVLVVFMLIFAVAGCNMGSTKSSPKGFGKFGPPEDPAPFDDDEILFALAGWITENTYAASSAITVANCKAPIVLAGDNKGTFKITSDGKGLELTNRTEDWAAVDFKLDDYKKYLKSYELELEYKITSTVGTKFKIAEPGSPYGTVKDTTFTAAAGSIKTVIPADYTQPNIRIQTEGAETTAFTITAMTLTFKGKRED